MKKLKYFIFSLICIFSLSVNVFAESEKVIIKSMTPVYDEQSSIAVTNEGNNHNVKFNDKDQVVKYNVVVENVSGNDLTVDEINTSKPSQDFIVYDIEGIKKGEVLKNNETKKIIVTLKTVEVNNSGTDFEEALLTIINFEKNIVNPLTSSKGLLLFIFTILVIIAIVGGSTIMVYKNNKFVSYVVLAIMCFSVVSTVYAKDKINLEIKINAVYESQDVYYDWSNKSSVFVGDSITYGTGTTKKYWEYLDESLNLSSVTGMGIGGSTISVKSDYGTQNTPLINRYTTIPDADLISIFMGTNDYGHETPLGTINDTTDISFYGALNVIVPALKKAHPNSRIVFITPIHRYGFGTSKILGTKFTYDNIENGRGAILEDYVNAIKEVCDKNSIPVIDLFTLFDLDVTDADIRTQYIPDGLHPNAEGHQVIADLIGNELRKISPINNTSDDNDEALENDITMQLGNAFDPNYVDDITRASASKNIYLKAGTVISLKNSTTYNYGVSNQTSESVVANSDFLSTWTTNTITISTDGWYGFTIKRVDNANLDLGGIDSNVITGYINFEEPEEIETDLNKTMILGNKFDSSYTSALNRATASKNVYLKAGTVISLKDSSTYNYGLIKQDSETITMDINYLTGGWTANSYTITSDGYYGIAVKRVDNANLDLGGTDPNVITGYINFN